MTKLPAIFVSHGSPMVMLEPSAGRDFLTHLADHIKRPRAILAVSAHWMTRVPTVSTDAAPVTVHDFGGFPDALYTITYPAPGAPDVGESAAQALRAAGIAVDIVTAQGLDHGAWVPLKLAYPDADIPVAQLSIQPHMSPQWHFELGRALSALRADDILILASGSITHNLRAMTQDAYGQAVPWAVAFTHWVQDAVRENRIEDLLRFAELAPFAAENHPSTEHFLPLFVALGAASADTAGALLHTSIDYRALAMDAYTFD